MDPGLSRSQTQGRGGGTDGMSATHRYFLVGSLITTPLPSCLLRLILPGRCCYTRFTDEGTEAQAAVTSLAEGLRTTVRRARTI